MNDESKSLSQVPSWADGMERAAQLLEEEAHSAQAFIDSPMGAIGDVSRLATIRDHMHLMAKTIRAFKKDGPESNEPSNEALTEHFPFGEAAHSGKKLPNRHPAEATLRRMLAFAYTNATGGYLYGDDGELQDNRLPWIDFVRDSVEEIEQKIHDRGMQEFIKAQAAKSEPPVEDSLAWQHANAVSRMHGEAVELARSFRDTLCRVLDTAERRTKAGKPLEQDFIDAMTARLVDDTKKLDGERGRPIPPHASGPASFTGNSQGKAQP